MFPKLQLGPLTIQTFGLMVAIAFLFGRWYMMNRLAPRFSATPERDRERLDSISLWMLLGVIAGGRLMYVIVEWDTFSRDLPQIVMIWKGGMVFYGGLIACFALGFWRLASWKRKEPDLNLWNLADLVLVAGFLGLGFGRWGCLLVGDDFGKLAPEGWRFVPVSILVPTELPEGSLLPGEHRGQWILATQLYMSACGFFLWGLGRFWLARRRFAGQITFGLPIGYAILRFLIEMARGDDVRGFVHWMPAPLDRLSTSQFVSLLIVPLSLTAYVLLARRRPPLPELEERDVAPAA